MKYLFNIFNFFLLLNAVVLPQPGVRYLDAVFTDVDVTSDIEYGESVAYDGRKVKLLLDIYAPANDTVTERPLIVFIHGGGFKSNDKVGQFNSLFAGSFAKRGYVVASINYRLSPSSMSQSEEYFKSLYRAVQDAKAAVRFFRTTAGIYKININQIFAAGSSAGAMTALHLAYMDQDEVPSFIDINEMGTIEGTGGNPGPSSKVQGVINLWGAMWNINWIEENDAPVFNVHGMADKTVPYDSSSTYHGFTYGSKIIYDQAAAKHIKSGLILFENTGHTLDHDIAKQDSVISEAAFWLYSVFIKGHSMNTGHTAPFRKYSGRNDETSGYGEFVRLNREHRKIF